MQSYDYPSRPAKESDTFVRLATGLVLFVAWVAVQQSTAQQPIPSVPIRQDSIQAWVSKHATEVRSIDPMDVDFGDLEPLLGAVGSARVVQLGEPSHGAGASFSAKVRLIKFLHQRMGFDVLAWESGLYDVTLAQAALGTNDDVGKAARRGILPVWSNAKELMPLFDYARTSRGTTRPLDIVGFDMSITAPGTEEQFAADLRSFSATLREPARRRNAAMMVERVLSEYERLQAHRIARQQKQSEASKAGLSGKALDDTMAAWEKVEGVRERPANADFDDFTRAINALLTEISDNRAVFEEVHSSREVGFMVRALENMRGRGANVYDSERTDPQSAEVQAANGWNRRDTLMAANLRWVIEEAYPRRKVIVWAHNAHIMNAHFGPDFKGVHLKPQPNGMTPTGVSLANWLKDRVYSIATTTYEGEERWTNFQRTGPIAPAPEGSLEARLHMLGKPLLFLDLRPARRGGKDHPMRAQQSMRISGFGPPTGPYGNDLVPDITMAFDAVFYIDRMLPATPICFGPC